MGIDLLFCTREGAGSSLANLYTFCLGVSGPFSSLKVFSIEFDFAVMLLADSNLASASFMSPKLLVILYICLVVILCAMTFCLAKLLLFPLLKTSLVCLLLTAGSKNLDDETEPSY